MCKHKTNFVLALEELDHRAAKLGDGKIVEKIAELFSKISVAHCTPYSASFWSKATSLVKELNVIIENDKTSVSRTLEMLKEKVDEVIRWERLYVMKMLLVILPLPLALAALAPMLAPIGASTYFVMLVSPFYASLFLLFTSIFLAALNPLSIIIGVLALVGLIDYRKELKYEELKVQKVERVSYEDLKKLYERIYGKEGEEILKYEIEIRLAKGMELEEALADIKENISRAV